MEDGDDPADQAKEEDAIATTDGLELAPDHFVKGPVKGIRAKKSDLDGRRAKEGAHDPGELGAHESISGKPGDKSGGSFSLVGSHGDEEFGEMEIGNDACHRDENGVRDEEVRVRTCGVFGVWCGRVQSHEEGGRGNRSEDKGGDGEAHELGHEGLLEAETAAQKQAEHAV